MASPTAPAALPTLLPLTEEAAAFGRRQRRAVGRNRRGSGAAHAALQGAEEAHLVTSVEFGRRALSVRNGQRSDWPTVRTACGRPPRRGTSGAEATSRDAAARPAAAAAARPLAAGQGTGAQAQVAAAAIADARSGAVRFAKRTAARRVAARSALDRLWRQAPANEGCRDAAAPRWHERRRRAPEEFREAFRHGPRRCRLWLQVPAQQAQRYLPGAAGARVPGLLRRARTAEVHRGDEGSAEPHVLASEEAGDGAQDGGAPRRGFGTTRTWRKPASSRRLPSQ